MTCSDLQIELCASCKSKNNFCWVSYWKSYFKKFALSNKELKKIYFEYYKARNYKSNITYYMYAVIKKIYPERFPAIEKISILL